MNFSARPNRAPNKQREKQRLTTRFRGRSWVFLNSGRGRKKEEGNEKKGGKKRNGEGVELS